MTTGVRRIVTGTTEDSKDIFVSEEWIPPVVGASGWGMYKLWDADRAPDLPTDGKTLFRRSGGPMPPAIGVYAMDFPAGSAGPMHATDTIDFVFILAGEIDLQQDDGAVVTLRLGDVLIQNGARHAWKTRELPCRVGFVMLRADRRGTAANSGTPA